MRLVKLTTLLFFTLFLQACATLKPLGFEDPDVSVTSVKVLPGNELAPTFEIKLHVINPNTIPLSLKGVSYNVSLEGHKILTGVSNQIPEIPAYGEGDITLKAKANVLNSFRLIASLLNTSRSQQHLSYELKAKLDLGTLAPNIYVTDNGEIKLR